MAKETIKKKYESTISNLYILELDIKFQKGIYTTEDPKIQKVLDKKKGIVGTVIEELAVDEVE